MNRSDSEDQQVAPKPKKHAKAHKDINYPCDHDLDDNGSEEEYDSTFDKQKLKAAVHYYTGQISEVESEKLGLPTPKLTVAGLTDLVYNYAECMANDLEMFAKHAKRSTVQPEDVLLCSRKSNSLSSMMSEFVSNLVNESEEKKLQKKRKKEKEDSTTKNKKAGGRSKKAKWTDDEAAHNDQDETLPNDTTNDD